ncbi:MAG: PD-(D/E)XK nuclease family protein [Candidatus Margulisiibacteriota bacterium]
MAKNSSAENNQLKFSPTALNLFLECPRCFWLQYNKGIHRPAGIFPSLPGGMDIVIKKYFDAYREKGLLPPEIEGKVDGRLLPDMELMKKWRNWRSGLSFADAECGAILSGALDDCLLDEDKYIPVDYKTRGFDLKEDSSNFYQNQLDCYTLLLEENGYAHANHAYLVYYIPKEVLSGSKVRFDVVVKKMTTNPERARQTLRFAVQSLKGEIPDKHSRCAYCAWGLEER